MPLLDDNGQPLNLLPPGVTPPPQAPPPAPNPAIAPSAPEPVAAAPAAAPPAFEPSAAPAAAAPISAQPAPQGAEPEPLPPPPSPPDWDSDDNPYRQLAAQREAEARQAQQQAAQHQAFALQQAQQQAQQRRAALAAQKAQLNQRVGEFTPEEFQRQANWLDQQIFKELQTAEAEQRAILVASQQERAYREAQDAWNREVESATAHYGLTAQEAERLRLEARDGDHLRRQAADIRDRRAERGQITSLTSQINELRNQIQQGRSAQAYARADGGVDQTGGTGGSPVPAPEPQGWLAQLRLAANGDPNKPVTPWSSPR